MAKKPVAKKAKGIVTSSGAMVIDPDEIRARTNRPSWAKKKK
tara:strand:- start:353 stop:478 length:126 start_codon:yes stop_codon:yes gene_type:complete